MKFVMQCLNHTLPTMELSSEKAVRLGPPPAEAPFSRVEAYPDYLHGKIRIKNLGVTKCLINFRQVLRHGEEVSINPGEIVDLTFGTYVYQARVGLNSTLMPTTLAEAQAMDHPPLNQSPSPRFGSASSSGQKFTGRKSDPSGQTPVERFGGDGVGGGPVEEEEGSVENVVSTTDSGMIVEDTSVGVVNRIGSRELGGAGAIDSELAVTSMQPTIQDSDWNMIQGRLGQMPVLVYGGDDVLKYKKRIAAFDLDLTIIQPTDRQSYGNFLPIVNGKVVTRSLWKFLYPTTVDTLRQFMTIHQDHKFIIVTNKAYAGFHLSKSIIEEVVLELDIPVIVFAAKEGTEFLKPAPFVWSVYKKFYNEERDPEWTNSLFCGDCGGRVKDISKGDRLFALNGGVDFKTPEEFFNGAPADPKSLLMPIFNPMEYVGSPIVARNNDHVQFKYKVEIILMCGIVASGKTRYVETALMKRGYAHVHPCHSMATVKSRLEFITNAINNKTSVVVDRRNIDTEERMAYIRLAHSLHTPIRCFVMNVSEAQARHNLRFHEIRTAKLFNAGEVELSMRRHKALFESPQIGEGFDEIVYVNFIPQTFLPGDLDLYAKFLIQR